MKTLTIIIAVLALFGCQPERDGGPQSPEVKSVVMTPNPEVPGYYLFDARVRLHGREGYRGILQEVRINGILAVIEFFEAGGGYWHDDLQRGGMGERREMTCWYADVEGVQLVNGFAMLWRTDLWAVNEDYAPPSGGSVTRRGERFEWVLDARTDGITITIDGQPTFYAK